MPEKVTTDVWRSTRRHVVVISSTAVMWHRHLWRLFHNDASCCVQFYCNCIRLCARAATSTSTCSVIASEQNFKYLMGHVIIIQKFEDPQINMLTYRNFPYHNRNSFYSPENDVSLLALLQCKISECVSYEVRISLSTNDLGSQVSHKN